MTDNIRVLQEEVRALQLERQILRAALQEIIDQTHYEGFGDAGSRCLYVTRVATGALEVA